MWHLSSALKAAKLFKQNTFFLNFIPGELLDQSLLTTFLQTVSDFGLTCVFRCTSDIRGHTSVNYNKKTEVMVFFKGTVARSLLKLHYSKRRLSEVSQK